MTNCRRAKLQMRRSARVRKIALIAQKGGGKTTLAVNLAVAAGPQTALFDLDPQEGAVIWADRRKAEAPHVEFLTERRLPDGLSAAEKQGFILAIIDTPPAAGPQPLPPPRLPTSC